MMNGLYLDKTALYRDEEGIVQEAEIISFEELCKAHFEIARRIDVLTDQKEALKQRILTAMPTKIATTAQYKVTKVQQVLVKTNLECARSLGYTVMKEQVDKETIRRLYGEGISIPDVEQIEYIKITEKL